MNLSPMWVLQVMYLFLPGVFANMAPPMTFVKKIPFGRPIWCPAAKKMSLRELEAFLENPDITQDRKDKIRLSGLGTNKTYRGLLVAVVAATLMACLQWLLYVMFDGVREFALYDNPNPFIIGPLWGIGAMAGDAVESLIMRRLNVLPGAPRLSDRFDFVLGAAVAVSIIIPIGVLETFCALLLAIPLHPGIKKVGAILKITRDGVGKGVKAATETQTTEE